MDARLKPNIREFRQISLFSRPTAHFSLLRESELMMHVKVSKADLRNNQNFDTFGIQNLTTTSPRVFAYPEPVVIDSVMNYGNGSAMSKQR
jgi:hypothetical protein